MFSLGDILTGSGSFICSINLFSIAQSFSSGVLPIMKSPGGIKTSSIPVEVVMVFSAASMTAGLTSSSAAAKAEKLTRFMIILRELVAAIIENQWRETRNLKSRVSSVGSASE